MKVKEELKGCWTILSTVLIIVIVVGLFLLAAGTIGEVMFDIASVLQNNMGSILIAAVAIGILIWFLKAWNKEE